MTLVKHNFRTFNDLFDEFFTQVPLTRSNGNGLNIPPVNLYESREAYHLELVAPGLKKEDFKVSLDKGLLTIAYEKPAEAPQQDVKTHRREFKPASFHRSFTIDEKINAEGIQAKYEDGILKLLFPKKEEVKVTPKEISID